MTIPGKICLGAGLTRIRLLLLIRRHQIGMRRAAQALMELDRIDGKTEDENDEPESD